jgi:quercetin dioxygenase-like cupin family protein
MPRLRLLGRAFFVLALVALSANMVMAQDPAKVAPETYKVTSDNEYVRVLDIHIKPSAKVVMHSHPGNVVVALTPCKIRFTSPDGKSQDLEFKAGETVWLEALSHSSENIGTSECHAVNIEVKAATAKKGAAPKAK